MNNRKLTRAESGRLGAIASASYKIELAAQRNAEYLKNPSRCKHCDDILLYQKRKNKFCNQSCSAIYNNTKTPKRKRKLRNNCAVCNEPTNYKVHCSRICQKQNKINEVLAGTATADACKKYLIKMHGAKCMTCGWAEINPTTGNVPIDLEHKDGKHTNNQLENLELICPNCHSLTPTYKSLNKGNGRKRRMTKYYSPEAFNG